MSKFSSLDSWKHPVATALAVAAVSYFGSISTALAGKPGPDFLYAPYFHLRNLVSRMARLNAPARREYLGLFLFIPIKTLVMGVAIACAVGVGSAHAADRFTTLDGIPAHVMAAQDMESVVGAGTLISTIASSQSPVSGDPDVFGTPPVPTGGIEIPEEAGGEGRVAAVAPAVVGLEKSPAEAVSRIRPADGVDLRG